ncbi:hypothetical protein LJC14_05870 [Treponema sp. OttesenSCG-928-L16]|nr:hypothetical protein [Treponema sp. OttesenSCG-928-L16]
MKYVRTYKKIVFSLLFFILISLSSYAEGFFSSLAWSFSASVYTIPEDNGSEGAPTPVLISAGTAAAYQIRDTFWMELSLDFYGTFYGYSESLDRAVPVTQENRWSFVLGSILGIQGVYKYDINDKFTLRAYGGPAADMRICFIASGIEGTERETASQKNSDIAAYFWGKGRWFTPVAGFGMDYAALDNLKLGLDIRIWMPAYKLWTGESLPFIEGWRFAAGIRLSLR